MSNDIIFQWRLMRRDIDDVRSMRSIRSCRSAHAQHLLISIIIATMSIISNTMMKLIDRSISSVAGVVVNSTHRLVRKNKELILHYLTKKQIACTAAQYATATQLVGDIERVLQSKRRSGLLDEREIERRVRESRHRIDVARTLDVADDEDRDLLAVWIFYFFESSFF